MEKNIFIFDKNKCVGCHACVVACMNENGLQSFGQWRNIYNSNDFHFPELALFYLSLACNHCDDAPCLKNCPALAYSKDEKTGAIIHDPQKCIGCKYCTWACPFDAPKFNPKINIVEKCNFCNHRIEDNLKPACAELCPTGALDFSKTDFSKEDSLKSSPVPVDVGSSIEIIKLRNKKGPELDNALFIEQTNEIKKEKKQMKISARIEWPLIVFSLLSAGLVSLYVSGKTEMFSPLSKLIYIAFGVLAAVFSIQHLGKKMRAWRSLLNIKNSYLSKEIGLFSLFFATIFCEFYLFDLPDLLIIITGILFLFSIDMVYNLAKWRWPVKIHSAQTMLIGISLFSLFYDLYPVFIAITVFRFLLYIYRKLKITGSNRYLSALRIISFVLSIVFVSTNQAFYLILAVVIPGEIIDRIEFYNELYVPDPQAEMEKV